MGTIDASIPLGVRPVQMESPLNMLAQAMQIQGVQNQNALAQYSLNKAQRSDQETNALAQLLQGGGIDLSTPEGQARAFQTAPTMAPGMIKNYMEGRKMTSDIGKNDAEARLNQSKVVDAALQRSRDMLAGVTTPEQYIQWHLQNHSDPVLGPMLASRGVTPEQSMARIQEALQRPGGFQDLLNESKAGVVKFMELNKPTTHVVNTGGTTQMVQVPGMGGAPQVTGTMQNTQSPDNAATNATHVQTTAMNNATSIKTTGMTNATSRANNADTIKKDMLVAGVNPDGSTSENVEAMARLISDYKAAPITGFALAKPQGQAIMRRVAELNPNYDETTYSSKRKAANDFTSGQQGNALRSVATANAHLDQMGELVDALNNGNVNLVNKIGNAYATQTGQPAPTNFDAVKNIIGQEVVKAIVAGGGTGGERDEAAAAFNNARSPQQLKGVIQHYRMVMGAQQANLLEQRKAAGLNEATLPSYSRGATPGMPDQSAIDAELKRRGVK